MGPVAPRARACAAAAARGRSALERFAEEVAQRKFDLIWYNNFNPLYIGVPYVINIFDLQHRLQPFFPEVSNNGQYEHREESYTDATRRAAMVTVGSEEAKTQLCHFYGVAPENVHVLPFPTPQKAIDIATGRLAVEQTAGRARQIRDRRGFPVLSGAVLVA
jgi:hypothetical protein